MASQLWDCGLMGTHRSWAVDRGCLFRSYVEHGEASAALLAEGVGPATPLGCVVMYMQSQSFNACS